MEGSTDSYTLTIIMISWTVMLISLPTQSAKPSVLLTRPLLSNNVTLELDMGTEYGKMWHLVNAIDSGSVMRIKGSKNNVAAMVTVVAIFFGQETSPILSLAKKIITHTIMKMNIWTRMEHII